jgi:hypothetical protein
VLRQAAAQDERDFLFIIDNQNAFPRFHENKSCQKPERERGQLSAQTF